MINKKTLVFHYTGGDRYKNFHESAFLDFFINRNAFTAVASVSTDDLDVAFERTNSIDLPWTDLAATAEGAATMARSDDAEVMLTAVALNGCRSTSVGDVMQIGENFYGVSRFGFKPLTASNLASIDAEIKFPLGYAKTVEQGAEVDVYRNSRVAVYAKARAHWARPAIPWRILINGCI